MNSDDFRNALHNDAAHQPPITPDLRAGIDRQVRRQRLRAIAVASPAVVVLLLGAAVLLPRGSQDTTLSVADGGAGTTVVTSVVPASTTSAPAASSTSPSSTEPPTTETTTATTDPDTGGSATTAAPTTATTMPSGPVSCGTVDIKTVEGTSLDKSESGPFSCFIKAFNAGVQTDLTIVVSGADGGRLTERITATADHVVTVTANGSMTVKLPAFSLGGGHGGGGLVPDDSSNGARDCGTISIDLGSRSDAKPDPKVFTCLMSAFAGSSSAHVTFVMHDQQGGTMTSSVDLNGTDHVLTVKMDGTTTLKLADHLQVPGDVMKAMPDGSMGLNELMNGMGGSWGGFGTGSGPDKHDK